MKRSQCLESFKVGEQHRFVIALIDYDLDQLLRTNGPPVLTEVFVNGSGVTVNCPCSGSYLAAPAFFSEARSGGSALYGTWLAADGPTVHLAALLSTVLCSALELEPLAGAVVPLEMSVETL